MSEPKESPTQQWFGEMEVILGRVATASGGKDDASGQPPLAVADPGIALREAYPAALHAAEQALALLVRPSIAVDALRIKTDLIEAAKAGAATGDHAGALGLLGQVQVACLAAQSEADKYADALSTAEAELRKLDQPVSRKDAAQIQKDLITAATQKVAADRAGASELLGQVAAACAAAQRDADRYAAALRSAETAVGLLVHPALVKDAEKITSDFITAAKAKAAGGERPEAMALLDKLAPACEAAKQEGVKYDQALLAANQAVALLVQPVVKNEVLHIKTTLIEAAKTRVSATGDRAGALGLLGQVTAACSAAKLIADKYAAALQVAEDAAAALTHAVVAPEVVLLKTETIEAAKTAAAGGDSGTAMSLLAQAAKRCQLAKVHTQRYVDGLALAKSRLASVLSQCQPGIVFWAPIGGAVLGVSDVIDDIRTKNIVAAETLATAGEYVNAMALLEALAGRVKPVLDRYGEYSNYVTDFLANAALLSTANTTFAGLTAAPQIGARLTSIQTAVMDPSKATAIAGSFGAAQAVLKPFGQQFAEVQTMLVKHQEFQTNRALAVTRIDSLSHADVAIDKVQITAGRLTAADAKVVAGDYLAALALLAKVDGECTAIADYGTQLSAAKAAVALLTQPAVAGDKARIQRERIDAALALAVTWDYAGAKLLLGKVAAECEGAKAVVTGAAEVAAANALAQGPIGAVKTTPEPAFKAVEDMVAALDGLGDVIKDDRDAIRAKIALARSAVAKPEEGGDPKALLEAAANACVVARGVADRHGQYLLALADAEAQLVGLTDPVIAADKAKIQLDRIDKAKENIKPPARDYAGALAELAKVQAECEAAKAILAQDVAYKSALAAAKLKVATLTEPLIASDRLGIETFMIAVAETKVTTRLYAEAMDLLAKVVGACDVARKVVTDEAGYQALLAPVETGLATEFSKAGILVSTHGRQPALEVLYLDIRDNFLSLAKTRAVTRLYGEAATLLATGATKLAEMAEVTNNHYFAYQEMPKADTAIATLEAHGGAGGVAAEIAAVKVLRQGGVDLLAAGRHAAAYRVWLEIQWACTAATKIAVLHEAYAPKLVTAKSRMVTCTGKVVGLSPAVAAIAEKLNEIQTRFVDAAEANAKGREYAGATGLLDLVDAQCAAVELLVTQHGLYDAALAAAESELIPLTQPVVAGDVERIRKDRIEAAKTLAAALDYTAALALLAKVKAECDAAAAVVAGNAAVAKGGEAAKKLLDGTPEGNTAALLEVEKLLKALTERHAARAAIKDRTDLIEQALVTARTLAPAEAKPKIEAIADQCVVAQEVGDRHVEYGKLLLAAEALVNGLTEPSMAADKAKITLDRIEAAKAKALLHDYRGALGLLDPVAAECTAARALAAEFDLYSSELVKAQSTLDGLNALTPVLDPQIGTDVQKISDECIAAAKTLALPATRDYAGARKLLARLDSRCKTAALKKSMLGGTDPTKGDIDAILLMDGGKKLLDDVIASLPATAKRSVVQAAMQARFNIELKNYTKDGAVQDATKEKTASLKKLYELMAMVPDAHTKDIKIDRFGGKHVEKANQDRGSFYRASETRVVLSCGRAKDTLPQPLENNVYALPDVEPDCELVPDGPTSPTPKYFDWTSLHELGHAIDDKKQFMAGKAGDAEFGGWMRHGRDVTPIAAAAAAKFNFPQGYIAEYLLTKSGTVPTAPLGRADWDACRAKAEAWCNALRVDKQLWERGSESKQCAIGGRVYHEAYAGDWVSYDVAARSKGVTGYQFRAPGEWLSELYAAHRMEKLKASHPANAWLATL